MINNMDRYNLNRFKEAQEKAYTQALSEIKQGRKQSHWMWFIFPQIAGLGMSATSRFYAISCLDEAKEYLADEILGSRLIEISSELLKLHTNDPVKIFGSIDAMKLQSSMTLFSLVDGAPDVFKQVLNKFYNGELDKKTINIIEKQNNNV